VILGGIIRNNVTATVNKIPILGDIPILGQIFRSTSKQKTKTELLVFMKPTIVRDPAEARRLREEEGKKLSKPTQDILKDQIKNSDKNGPGKGKGDGGN
jgi:general secretion pathway protein D